jgi:hypothetical protein
VTTNAMQAAIPAGAVDHTPPNFGLVVVFTTTEGAAYRCLACNAGTRAGSYDLAKTRLAARWHREGSCPHRGAHHITKTVMASQPVVGDLGRRRRTPRDSVTYPMASCTCGWKAAGEDDDRESGRRLARTHRDAAHAAWLEANHTA